MKENHNYIEFRKNRSIFIQEYIPTLSKQGVFLFLNPIFDEKNRVNTFQAHLARKLCKNGFHVFRFDYYGTGDSGGDFSEFDIDENLNDMENICHYIMEKTGQVKIIILGVRIGADIAYSFALNQKNIHSLFLIEPVVNITRYFKEQEIRRSAFFKINKIENYPNKIMLDGKEYEDFQGYLISESCKSQLLKMTYLRNGLINKKIFLFKTDNLFSKKQIEDLKDEFSKFNEVKYLKVNVQEFWASPEPLNFSELVNEISTQSLN